MASRPAGPGHGDRVLVVWGAGNGVSRKGKAGPQAGFLDHGGAEDYPMRAGLASHADALALVGLLARRK